MAKEWLHPGPFPSEQIVKEIRLGERLLQVPDAQATVAAIGGVSVDWIVDRRGSQGKDEGRRQDGFEFRDIQNGSVV